MPTHGEYQAGFGFYDSSLKAWIKDPAKLTETITSPGVTDSQRRELEGWGQQRPFKRVTDLDAMIRLRDSDRPEDRAHYERFARGSNRIQVSDYERSLAQAKADGREIQE